MPGLRFAVRTQRAPRFDRDVLKLSVLLVLIKRARGRIVRHINIGPAIIVEIRGQHAQAVGPVRFENSRRLGNIGERPVTVVVIENVLPALQPRRPASHHHALVQARTRFRHRSRR